MAAEVLIVDDDVDNLRFLRDWLLRYADRFTVVTAQDGVEALEVLSRREIAVVVTDLRMPRLDGFGLLLRMAERFPQIPKIVMTSLNSPVTQYQAEKNDILDYLVKPVSPEQLAKRLHSVLESHADSGFLKGISISSFAQLVDIEQKTCTITVQNTKDGRNGALYFREGRLINATLGSLAGMDAASRILTWPDVRITIKDSCPDQPDSIRRRIQDVLMLSAQIVDEAVEAPTAGRVEEEAAVARNPGLNKLEPVPAPESDELRRLDDEELLDRALDSFRQARYDDARRCWQAALTRNPGNKMVEHNLKILEQKVKKLAQPPGSWT